MSSMTMADAWAIKIRGERKLLLLALADSSNDDNECRLGLDTVARLCGMTEEEVNSGMSWLEKKGYIRTELQDDMTVYHLMLLGE